MGGPSADVFFAMMIGSNNASAKRQTAILLGLLLAVQFAAAVLTPLGGDETAAYAEGFVLAAIGVSVAWPPLLALWAVFGPQRAAVRLPLTLWLAGAINLASLYGLNRNTGENGAQLLMVNAAWLAALGVLQAPLWLIRAVRRWRLEAAEGDAAAAGPSAAKASSQFSLRSLLGWTLAAALLLAALRWLTPDDGFDGETMLTLLPEAGVIGLAVALGGLPVVALAWIVLADGRRRILRIVLGLLIVLGLSGAGVYFGKLSQGLSVGDMLTLEAGTILNGLISLGVVRVCGYQLRRRPKKVSEAETESTAAAASISRMRFAFALAPLVVIAAGLASSIPHRLEMWREAEIRSDWNRTGVQVSFDNQGEIVSAQCTLDEPVGDETCRRLATLVNLSQLALNGSRIDDRRLALLSPLARLENLDLSGTQIADQGLKQLTQFPQLATLNLSNTHITDAGLKHLRGLPKLQQLQLSLTDISDEGLSALERLPELRSVNAQLTAVTAAGAEKLSKANPGASVEFGASDALLSGWQTTTRVWTTNASGVQTVGIGRVSIKVKRLHARGKSVTNGVTEAVTDAGLITLSVVQTELEELDLRDSEVTDKGLWTLRALKQLKRLDVRGAPVTEKGVRRLARVLPECEILR
ncbi:MAG TPA: hypothetical protein VMV10_02925 [Pirellulales bacterium]|nr:hypothetical protein [Pirellulales bacterium]